MSAWFIIRLQIWSWIEHNLKKSSVIFCKGKGANSKEPLVGELMSCLGGGLSTVPFWGSVFVSVYSLVKLWQSGRGSGLNAFHFASSSFSEVRRVYWFDWWSTDELTSFCNNCGDMKDQNYTMASYSASPLEINVFPSDRPWQCDLLTLKLKSTWPLLLGQFTDGGFAVEN